MIKVYALKPTKINKFQTHSKGKNQRLKQLSPAETLKAHQIISVRQFETILYLLPPAL